MRIKLEDIYELDSIKDAYKHHNNSDRLSDELCDYMNDKAPIQVRRAYEKMVSTHGFGECPSCVIKWEAFVFHGTEFEDLPWKDEVNTPVYEKWKELKNKEVKNGCV